MSGGEADEALRLRRKKHGIFEALVKSTVTSRAILPLGGVQATAESERAAAKRVPSGEECLICQIGATWAMTLGNTRTVMHLLSVTAALPPLGAPNAAAVDAARVPNAALRQVFDPKGRHNKIPGACGIEGVTGTSTAFMQTR